MRAKSQLAVVATAAPVVFETVRRYWPLVRKILEENPQIAGSVQNQIAKLARLRRSRPTFTSLSERIALLRDQVGFLAHSSDSESEAARAARYRTRLQQFETSLRVIATASPKVRARELKRVSVELDTLTDRIVSALITESAEDGAEA